MNHSRGRRNFLQRFHSATDAMRHAAVIHARALEAASSTEPNAQSDALRFRAAQDAHMPVFAGFPVRPNDVHGSTCCRHPAGRFVLRETPEARYKNFPQHQPYAGRHAGTRRSFLASIRLISSAGNLPRRLHQVPHDAAAHLVKGKPRF